MFLLVLNKVPVHSYSVEEITGTTQLEYDEVMIKDVPHSVKAKPGNQDMHNTRIPGINHEVECEREKSQELGHISLFGNITRNYSKDTGKDQCLSTVLYEFKSRIAVNSCTRVLLSYLNVTYFLHLLAVGYSCIYTIKENVLIQKR